MSQTEGDAKKRRRRTRARVIAFIGYSAAAIGLAWFFDSQATTTVIFVRHADTDSPLAPAAECTLNEAGRARAELLADLGATVDVRKGFDAIYASSAPCTQETAAAVAKRLGLEVEIDDPYEVERFMREVMRDHKGEVVLVVTHSDAIAPLIDELHGSKHLAQIAPDQYDNVYIVTIPWFGKVKTLQWRYGEPWRGPLSISSDGTGAGAPAQR